jgi:hypothetical protein
LVTIVYQITQSTTLFTTGKRQGFVIALTRICGWPELESLKQLKNNELGGYCADCERLISSGMRLSLFTNDPDNLS